MFVRVPSPALVMSGAQREIMESQAKSQRADHREVILAKALLLAASSPSVVGGLVWAGSGRLTAEHHGTGRHGMVRHTFAPERYYTTMGTHLPALWVTPGDTVVTTTVDSIGHDATEEPITPRFNPMTGPFFVEGAEPGDTLVVRLDRLVLNRPNGVSVLVLAPNVVDPEFVRRLPGRPLVEWAVDLARGNVSLHTAVPGLEAVR